MVCQSLGTLQFCDVLAQGLARYDSTEAALIAGRRSDEIPAVLGYEGRAALVHRDDMAVGR